MKLFIAAILLGVSTLTYAQPNLLGKSEKQVKDAMQAMTNVKFLMRGITSDGYPYLEYFDENDNTLTYRFSNDRCNYYIIGYSMKYLPQTLEYLNKQETKLNDSTWFSINMNYKVEMKYGTPGKDVFWLTYTPKYKLE